MSKDTKTKGSEGLVGAVVLLVILALFGLVAYRVMDERGCALSVTSEGVDWGCAEPVVPREPRPPVNSGL